MMQTASISSLPFATGTSTDAAALQTSALRPACAPPTRRLQASLPSRDCKGWL